MFYCVRVCVPVMHCGACAMRMLCICYAAAVLCGYQMRNACTTTAFPPSTLPSSPESINSHTAPLPQQNLLVHPINRHVLFVLETVLSPHQLKNDQTRTSTRHLSNRGRPEALVQVLPPPACALG